MNGLQEKPDSPPIYLSYSQYELDRAFDQAQWAPNMKALVARWAETSRQVRDCFTNMQVRSYGSGSNENLEIFLPKLNNAPIHAFIHGGEWKRRDNFASAFPATSLTQAGFNFINLNFEAVPRVTIPEMLDQVRRAIMWIHRNAREFGANPNEIHLSGHSSGAHLAAVLSTTRWEELGLPSDIIKSVVCMSGLYDMEPVLLSMRREWVKLTRDEARELSPVRNISRVGCPVTVIYGENDSPEFKRQANVFHEALLAGGGRSKVVQMKGQNHFEVLDALHNASSQLAEIIIAQKS